ncbi:UbiA family prenyltransferase [Halobaculum sp. P14]|uniref:UbiA family prenyltransferase n=1 Tax=Halobaculum sp. P14 TaxID=3421638 RepID=UPI003EB9DC9A
MPRRSGDAQGAQARGAAGVARALAAQVKPTFMLPAVATSVFGALLAPDADPVTAALHAAGVGAALYVAHVVDEYVDTHRRGEEPPTLPRRVLASTAAAGTVLVVAAAAALWVRADPVATASLAALWALAVLHAPVLDRNTVAVTVDYPVGIAAALVGGFAAQTGAVSAAVLAVAAVFAVLLSGEKVAIDRLDAAFDRTVDKRTVPVVVGDRRAAQVAAGVLALSGGLVAGFAAVGVLPRVAAGTAVFPLAAAAVTVVASPRRAVQAAMALTYPFAAALFVVVCAATQCHVAPLVEAVLAGVG